MVREGCNPAAMGDSMEGLGSRCCCRLMAGKQLAPAWPEHGLLIQTPQSLLPQDECKVT